MREDAAPVYDINEWMAADPRWRDAVGSDENIFYPVQQDPTSGYPYIRYSSTLYVPSETFWYHQDEIMYAAYSDSVDTTNRLMNIVLDKVKAGDKSGAELEAWRREKAKSNDIYTAFTYHATEWVAGGSTQPTEERGGAHARLFTFRVWYSPLDGTFIA